MEWVEGVCLYDWAQVECPTSRQVLRVLASLARVVTLRSRANDPRPRRTAEKTGSRVEVVRRNSPTELRRVLNTVFHVVEGTNQAQVREAVAEVEHAIERVLS